MHVKSCKRLVSVSMCVCHIELFSGFVRKATLLGTDVHPDWLSRARKHSTLKSRQVHPMR